MKFKYLFLFGLCIVFGSSIYAMQPMQLHRKSTGGVAQEEYLKKQSFEDATRQLHKLLSNPPRKRDERKYFDFNDQVAELLNRGADPNGFIPEKIYPDPPYKWARTYLDIAINLNEPELVELLLRAGADPNRWYEHMNAPTIRLLRNIKENNLLKYDNFDLGGDDYKILILLLNHGADSRIALEYALENMLDPIIVKKILEFGVQLNKKNDKGRTLLFYVKRPDHLRLLLEAGANPNITDDQNRTVLNAFVNIPEALQLLIDFGADPNIQDNLGNSALIYAIDRANKEGVRLLLAGGADPNIVNKSETPLIFAVKKGHESIVHLLMENGANPNLPNQDYNAKTVAQKRGDQTIFDLLNANIPIKKAGLKRIP